MRRVDVPAILPGTHRPINRGQLSGFARRFDSCYSSATVPMQESRGSLVFPAEPAQKSGLLYGVQICPLAYVPRTWPAPRDVAKPVPVNRRVSEFRGRAGIARCDGIPGSEAGNEAQWQNLFLRRSPSVFCWGALSGSVGALPGRSRRLKRLRSARGGRKRGKSL